MAHSLFTAVRPGMRPAGRSISGTTQVPGTAAIRLRVPASAQGIPAIFTSKAVRPRLMGLLSSKELLPPHFLGAVWSSSLVSQRPPAIVCFLLLSAAFLSPPVDLSDFTAAVQ